MRLFLQKSKRDSRQRFQNIQPMVSTVQLTWHRRQLNCRSGLIWIELEHDPKARVYHQNEIDKVGMRITFIFLTISQNETTIDMSYHFFTDVPSDSCLPFDDHVRDHESGQLQCFDKDSPHLIFVC